MKIAFDAKRAFHNHRGLGNYSRDTIRLLGQFYPENEYLLYNPSQKNKIGFLPDGNFTEINPTSVVGKLLPSLWRSSGMCYSLSKEKADIYHGLSQELPFGFRKTGAKGVVTIHDAIFMRYPELYSASYRAIFIKKNQYACKVADKIIAISEQTKRDVIEFFQADERKIDVVYQGCHPAFRGEITKDTIERTRMKYQLPQHFLLNVGAIEKRKNVSLILKAMHAGNIDIPLVIIGKESEYKKELVQMIDKLHLNNKVIFIHNAISPDLPAIYRIADLFIYPSFFEGFGIPILEALYSSTPVITSTGSCFEETGGPGSRYINPNDAEQLANTISEIISSESAKQDMIHQGLTFAEKFKPDQIAQSLYDVYKSTLCL